jgi:D-threo-aldose 1-dehydrogenase
MIELSAHQTKPALRLGFGCSSLGSEIGYRDSCALIELAYEAGFRHFDVAPSYGNGMAERILGDVLSPVRPHITLVSKAGIAPPRNARLFRAVRKAVLPIRSRWPGLWRRAAVNAQRASVPRGQFRLDEVQFSLDESLKRLRTDQLDAFLLHEVRAGDVSEDLAMWLSVQRAGGRVKAVGIGTDVTSSIALLALHPELIEWVQVNHYWGAFEPAIRRAGKLVTHRCIRTGTELLRQASISAALPDAIVRQLKNERQFAQLLVHAALAATAPLGITLVSTTKPHRIREFLQPLMDQGSDRPYAALNSELSKIFSSGHKAEPVTA